ncbi:MAG TPA: hypothetical protein VEW71_00055 [Allosphingosinicella sp.]|nr:hypothetical protein [Allosphingosinicella sp.]
MAIDQEDNVRLPRTGPAILLYCATLLAAIAVCWVYRPGGVWLALTIAVPVAALVWMISRARARRAAGCDSSPAERAYLRRFFPTMGLYVIVLFGAIWLNKALEPSGPLAVVLAILPALPLIGVVWAIGRLIVDETDEYQRSLTVRQVIVATGFMLAVTSVWGFLETFEQVPHVPMYWAFIIWCAGLGVGTLVNEMKS